MRRLVTIAFLAALLLFAFLSTRERVRRSERTPVSGSRSPPAGDSEEAKTRPGSDVLEGVVDIHGAPVAGASVTYEPDEDELDAPPRTTAKSDEQGRFALLVRRIREMSLDARHPEFRLTHEFVDADDPEPVRIVLERGAPLKVAVRGPRGSVAGAAVEATVRVLFD